MQKQNKRIIFRCDDDINTMIEEYMVLRSCDKSTAVRELLKFLLDLGGASMVVGE